MRLIIEFNYLGPGMRLARREYILKVNMRRVSEFKYAVDAVVCVGRGSSEILYHMA